MSGSYGASPRLLFVCTANICRSAYAEVRSRQMLGLDAGWAFFSAGVPGTVGREMDPPMVAQAVARGVALEDCLAMRSRQMRKGILRRSRLVVTMANSHRVALLDDFPAYAERYWTLGQLADAATLLQRDDAWLSYDTDQLVQALHAVRGPAGGGRDVADPYRRGDAAMAAAADTIDAYLRTILPLLSRG